MISLPIWVFVILCLPFGFTLLSIIIFGISEIVEHISVRKFRKRNHE